MSAFLHQLLQSLQGEHCLCVFLIFIYLLFLQDSNSAPDGLWAGPNVLSRDVVTIAKRIKVPSSAAPRPLTAHSCLSVVSASPSGCSCPPLNPKP